MLQILPDPRGVADPVPEPSPGTSAAHSLTCEIFRDGIHHLAKAPSEEDVIDEDRCDDPHQ